MTFDLTLLRAVSPAVSRIRPWPLTALAVLYVAGGALFAFLGLTGSFDASQSYAVGELRLGPGVARALAITFGAALAWVGYGLYQLKATAWRIFVCAVWVGIALEALWLVTVLARGGLGAGYVLSLAIDAALLYYVHRQRRLFIN